MKLYFLILFFIGGWCSAQSPNPSVSKASTDQEDYDVPRPPPGAPQSDAPLDAPAGPAPNAASEDRSLPARPAVVKMGWVSAQASLILYGPAGDVSQEVGLKSWDEHLDNGKVRRHLFRGGCSADGHFAWSWERVQTFPSGQIEKAVEESRTLRYFGDDGGELWRDDLTDVSEGSDPVAMSSTGEFLVMSERAKDYWAAALVNYQGDRLIEARGKGPIDVLAINPQGKYGLAGWHPLDQPMTYTFFDLEKKKKVVLDKIPPLPVTLGADGVVRAGSRIIFDPRSANDGSHH